MLSRFTGSPGRQEIIGLLLFSAIVLFAALLQAANLLPSVLGTCLLLLPGYLLTWSTLQTRIGTAGAVAVGGATSIGLAAIGGLVLNLLPWGLQPATWLAYAVVLSAIGIALNGLPRVTGGVMRHEVALFGLAGVVVLVALVTAQLGASSATGSFTQLWLRPAPGGSPFALEIDVRSEERASTGFRLELWQDGVLVRVWQEIHLEPGQLWSATVDLGRAGRAKALLFRLSDPGVVYRETTLTLPSASGVPIPSTPPAADS